VSFRLINPETLGAPRGYNHGLLSTGTEEAAGRILFVAGQTARDDAGRISAGTVAGQWERALANVMEVVRAAGGGPEHVGRLTIYVTDRDEYLANLTAIGQAYRTVMGRHYPAIALVEVAGLVDEGAAVEIEATAVVPADASEGESRPVAAPDPSPARPSEE
jgi:enamine deaminase RidA (YjgF/YER057c/UK114 family)